MTNPKRSHHTQETADSQRCGLVGHIKAGYGRVRVYLPSDWRVAQSVERATLGEEVPGSIPAAAASSLLVGSVSV